MERLKCSIDADVAAFRNEGQSMDQTKAGAADIEDPVGISATPGKVEKAE